MRKIVFGFLVSVILCPAVLAQDPAAAQPAPSVSAALVPVAQKERERAKPVIEEVPLPPYSPIAEQLSSQLSVPLHFSQNQRKRVTKAVAHDIDNEIMDLAGEYEKVRGHTRRIRHALNDYNMQMFMLKADMYEDIRPLLDDTQKEKLDHMVYGGYFSMYDNNNSVYKPKPVPSEPVPVENKQENVAPPQQPSK
ncbi:MAG: hypothetical protein WCS77_05830 [Elusimicrobiaceae bacterium]